MWLLMITLMLRFQWTNIRWWPPWKLFKSRRLSFNYLTGHSILSALDGLRWAIPGTVIHSGEPVTVVDSLEGNKVPAKEIPQVVIGCVLSRMPTCRARRSMREDMITVSLKPMLAGLQFSWFAILGKWRHPRIPLEYHTVMQTAVSIKIKVQDEGPTWAQFCVAPDIPARKLWWVAWCADLLPDRKPNEVTQKPHTCDVK